VKLEDFISKRLGIGTRAARACLLEGRVSIDDTIIRDHRFPVSRFEKIVCNGEVLQKGQEKLYLMLNKPAGILSATSDPEHRTVLDLVDHPDKGSLHLAGRLDRSSTGLVLLTNDGSWSESLTLPGRKVAKVYLVETDRPIPPEAVDLFRDGFEFPTEGIITLPARLEILSPTTARVTLHEGRYHQIKRMFHRIDGIRLRALHRESIGEIALLDDLRPGEWRPLTLAEVTSIQPPGKTGIN
jgi:16S rRNA pseudouridine516 synthase